MAQAVGQQYAKRASEYISQLGSMGNMNPCDIDLITRWGTSIDGLNT